MSKKEFNELMGAINSIKAEVAELRSEVDTLKSSSKKSSTSKTVSGKKSTPKKTASSKVAQNGGKVYKADRPAVYAALGWTKKNGEFKANYKFDRAKYEAQAKAMGLWHEA